jgi:hypothetical protein
MDRFFSSQMLTVYMTGQITTSADLHRSVGAQFTRNGRKSLGIVWAGADLINQNSGQEIITLSGLNLVSVQTR